jgi:hypothetical protein
MKKYIALFSLVALAVLAVSVSVNAGSKCTIKNNVGDDYFATCSSSSVKSFVASNDNYVRFDTTTINAANSGANGVTAGEDLENASITTGSADAQAETSYDVASSDIVYYTDDNSSESLIEGNTELEDAVLVSSATETSAEVVSNTTDVEAHETDVIVGNSGLNMASAGEDGENVHVETGNSSTYHGKTWFVGYQRIYRNATP